nr:MAG TPA: hypothetical protein [Caudoviricetes sp.]DAZ43407.1 MAG TPA: hypothetical protein [Caudoviricetes sp.]
MQVLIKTAPTNADGARDPCVNKLIGDFLWQTIL